MPHNHIKNKNSYVENERDCETCIKAVVKFLQLFVPETTARKVVSVILIAAGLSVSQITKVTGLSDKSIQTTGRAIRDGSIGDVLTHKKASGRKRKTADVEEQIIAELESGNYYTRTVVS